MEQTEKLRDEKNRQEDTMSNVALHKEVKNVIQCLDVLKGATGDYFEHKKKDGQWIGNNQNANRGDTNQNVTGGDTNQNVTAGDNNQTVNGGNSSALSNSSIGDINNYVSNNPYISPYIVVEETPCHMCAYRNTGCGKRPHEYCRTDASPKTGDEDAAGLLGSLIAAAACIITAAIVLIRRWRYSR